MSLPAPVGAFHIVFLLNIKANSVHNINIQQCDLNWEAFRPVRQRFQRDGGPRQWVVAVVGG